MQLSNEVRDYLLEVSEMFFATVNESYDINVEKITDGRYSKCDDLACASMSLAELDNLHELSLEFYAELRRELLALAIKEYGFLDREGQPGEYWLPFFGAVIPRVEEFDGEENISALRRRQERMIDKQRRSAPRQTAVRANGTVLSLGFLDDFWETLSARRSPFS